MIQVINAISGFAQNSPFHIHDLLGHTQAVVDNLIKMGRVDLVKVGWLHDVGKLATKAFNPKKGHDTYYKHAQASVKWADDNAVFLTAHERSLIEGHDLNFENAETVKKYINKMGRRWVKDQLAVREADALAQNTEHPVIKRNIANINQSREWLKEATMPRNWEANTFVMRQTDPAFAGTVVTEADIEVILNYINLREDKGREGYAPFVTKWDIPINLLKSTRCGEAEITPENSHLLKSGYKTRREGELPYLTRWFEGMEKPLAARVVAICYSREQLESEKEQVNGLKGDLILVLAGPSEEVDPSDTMDPATMLRNALGREFGGSGHPLNKEMYVRMCAYYDKHALIG